MKNLYPKLNYPQVKLKARRAGEVEQIWDKYRGIWLVLTPEEWVRRHVVEWLAGQIAPIRIIQECPVNIEGMAQRADLVVSSERGDGNPLLLVECKAPYIQINREVLDQALRYNSVIGARYVMLTNGLENYFFERKDSADYTKLDSVPPLG